MGKKLPCFALIGSYIPTNENVNSFCVTTLRQHVGTCAKAVTVHQCELGGLAPWSQYIIPGTKGDRLVVVLFKGYTRRVAKTTTFDFIARQLCNDRNGLLRFTNADRVSTVVFSQDLSNLAGGTSHKQDGTTCSGNAIKFARYDQAFQCGSERHQVKINGTKSIGEW